MKCKLQNYKKYSKEEKCSRFKDNILAANLAEMESLPPFNCGLKYLLCLIDVFTKYSWVRPLSGKTSKTALDGFIGTRN